MRYKTTHTRAFHKCLNDLMKLRAEKRKADLGFEAQKVANERHEMRKQSHHWEVLKKDVVACRQLSDLAAQNSKAREQNPAFDDAYEAELAKPPSESVVKKAKNEHRHVQHKLEVCPSEYGSEVLAIKPTTQADV